MSITPEQASCKDANISESKDLELQTAHVLELDSKRTQGDYTVEDELCGLLFKCGPSIIHHQQEQLRVAREALEFYADDDNWRSTVKYGVSCIGADDGSRAKEAKALLEQHLGDKP